MARGTRNGASKLDEDKVRSIRARYEPGLYGGGGPMRQRGNKAALAAEFDIHPRTVLAIVYGETWSWVD